MNILSLVLSAVFIFLGAWIVQLNVNDIMAYYSVGQAAPIWPFAWILLVLTVLIGTWSSNND